MSSTVHYQPHPIISKINRITTSYEKNDQKRQKKDQKKTKKRPKKDKKDQKKTKFKPKKHNRNYKIEKKTNFGHFSRFFLS